MTTVTNIPVVVMEGDNLVPPVFEAMIPDMYALIQSNTDDTLQIDLGSLVKGLMFRFHRETKADGSAEFRRQFGCTDDRRFNQAEMKIVKEMNELTRAYVVKSLGSNHKGMEKYRWCSVCRQVKDECKWCVCKTVRYCGKECQTKDWKEHKKVCGK